MTKRDDSDRSLKKTITEQLDETAALRKKGMARPSTAYRASIRNAIKARRLAFLRKKWGDAPDETAI